MVHKGQIWACNEDLEHLINALSQSKAIHFNNHDGIPLLTHREEEVVRLVADGMKNREIAETLHVKEHSIRNYIYRIFEKVGVSTRVELAIASDEVVRARDFKQSCSGLQQVVSPK
jgi:DNA-binding NarL/FixJ family response regulator